MHLRVARPTNHLAEVVHFYKDGLGFEILGGFENHDHFSGIMLGHPELGYHLEFTQKNGHDAGRAPTEDNLLIFYLPEPAVWEEAVRRMESSGYQAAPSFNPYWDVNGKTFEDPDGYRVVLQNTSWPVNQG